MLAHEPWTRLPCHLATAQPTFHLYLDPRRPLRYSVESSLACSLVHYVISTQHRTQPGASVILKRTGDRAVHRRLDQTHRGTKSLAQAPECHGVESKIKSFPWYFSHQSAPATYFPLTSCQFAGFRNCSSPHTSSPTGSPRSTSSQITLPCSTCSASGPCRQQQQQK